MINREFYRNVFIQRGCSVKLADAYIDALESEDDGITKECARDELRRAGYDPDRIRNMAIYRRVN